MKKCAATIILMLLLVLTSACGSAEQPVVSEPNYQYGNMQKNQPSGNYILHEGDVLFSTWDERRGLFSYSLETGKVSHFCKDATCMHNTSKCVSRGVESNLEAYGGEFYAMSDDVEIKIRKGDSFETYLDGSVSTFWHANSNLYVETADRSLLVYENGSKKPKTVLEEYTGFWNVIFGSYLYGSTGESVIRVDLSADAPQIETVLQEGVMHSSIVDGHHIYYMNASDNNYLYRCDLDGSNVVCLLEKSVLAASMNFDNEYLYFRLYTNAELDGVDSTDVYRMNKADPSQIELIAQFPEPIFQIFTVPSENLLFVTTRDNVERQVYTISTDGSNLQKLEIP